MPMTETRFFRVRNFDALQHYTDRSPPWIKLYNRILDDYEIGQLGDAARWHFVAIMLLASRYDNRIPWDIVWITKRIAATQQVDLDALAKARFIEEIQGDAVLAPRKRRASKMLAQRRERERGEKMAAGAENLDVVEKEETRWRARLRTYKSGGFWPNDWGPRPESGKCASCPPKILDEWRNRA